MEKQTHKKPANGATAMQRREAPPAQSIELAPTLAPEIASAFKSGLDVSIPSTAERVEYVPSFTVPVGATVQGQYGGSRTEEVQDEETGEVKTFDSHLFRDLNGSGQDVWLRGGWNFGQLIRLAKTREGERITLVRKADKQHPHNPVWRIGQYDFYRG